MVSMHLSNKSLHKFSKISLVIAILTFSPEKISYISIVVCLSEDKAIFAFSHKNLNFPKNVGDEEISIDVFFFHILLHNIP